MKSAKLLTALAAVVGVSALFAGCFSKPITIEILHVNDLHSNFDYGRTPDKGGYAAVKTALETMKNAAVARGHQVLTLNGGDSFEGHPYYFLNKGAESMKMVSLLPFDATVVGNHDFLMGPADFDRLIGQSPAGFTWLASNISFDRSKYPNLARVLKRYVTFNKGGLRIAVIGLTTDSPFYRWALGDVVIRNPLIAAQELVAELRLQNDVIIALSHLGTSDDISLVEHTIGIDLVVGSHDHTPLYQPLIKKNPIGKHIPILQSEPFGEGVGHLTITVKKDRSYSIDGYEIAKVDGNVTGRRDANLVALAKAAAGKLDAQFG
ncbi:MAG: metallophosphatase, partial [Deltaproteobacteria bacterium]|nr:metallophosphatase [Deltaproteobacteria bacterium]